MKAFFKFSCVFLFLFQINLISADFDFQPQRLITDFNGVVYDGTNVLAYGDYGIITYSSDKGETWQQMNIGDEHNIEKIINNDKRLIGITKRGILISKDNGMDWEFDNLDIDDNFIDMTALNNNLFILVPKSLIKVELDNDFNTEIVHQFDSSIKYIELENNDKDLFLLSNTDTLEKKHILKINPETFEIDTIMLNIEREFKDYDYNVSNLNLNKNNLVLVLNRYDRNYPNMPGSNYLKVSADGGESWSGKVRCRSEKLRIIEDDIYNLSTSSFKKPEDKVYKSVITLSRFERKDGSNFEELILSDTTYRNERYLEFDENEIREFIKLDDNVFIAIGENKLILRSDNNGRTFEILSLYRSDNKNELIYYRKNRPPVFLDNGYLINTNRYFSSDGGVTWKVPKYSDNRTVLNLWADQYYFGNNGKGFFVSYGQNSKILKTNDYGDTYFEILKPGLSQASVTPFNRGFEINGEVILSKYELDANYSIVFRFDQDANIIDSVRLDSVYISNIVMDGDGRLYTVGLNLPQGFDGDSVYSYSLLASTDNGKSWKIKLDDLPLTQHFVNDHYFNAIKAIYQYKDHILIPDIWSDPTKFLVIDTETNEIDEVTVPFRVSLSDEAMFEFQEKVHFISYTNTIYRTDMDGFFAGNWDSVHVSEYLNGWQDYIPNSNAPDRDIIYSTWANNNQVFFVVLKSKITSGIGLHFEANIVKMFVPDTTSVEETETQKAYFYHTDPFPVPASQEVRSKIFWNSFYTIDNVKFGLYDMFGEEYPNAEISVDPINAHSAYLTWNCLGFNRGVYFIRMSLGGESMTIPVLVGGR